MPKCWIPCKAAGLFILVIGLVYCELRAVQREARVKTAHDRFYFSLFINYFPQDLSEKTVNVFTVTQKSVMTLDAVHATIRKNNKTMYSKTEYSVHLGPHTVGSGGSDKEEVTGKR